MGYELIAHNLVNFMCFSSKIHILSVHMQHEYLYCEIVPYQTRFKHACRIEILGKIVLFYYSMYTFVSYHICVSVSVSICMQHHRRKQNRLTTLDCLHDKIKGMESDRWHCSNSTCNTGCLESLLNCFCNIKIKKSKKDVNKTNSL